MSVRARVAAGLMIAGSTWLAGSVSAEPLVIADGGRSEYVIYQPDGAPTSVQQAAAELRRVLEIATGAALPVQNQPRSPMIALGDSPATAEAGLVGADLPAEGYRILTRGQDIFIVGNDTPDGGERWNFQDSSGTLYGVYAFLEQVVGVRWLMPGEVGEDIPRHEKLTVPDLDLQWAPAIPFRALPYVQDRDERVALWKLRNGVQKRYKVSFGHSWDDYPPISVLQQHPEYMAMYPDGTRQPVPKPGEKSQKYCLTNPGLIEAFADSINALFDADPKRWHASLSPSDGGGFCECPECTKYKITDDGGKWGNFGERGYSITPVVLRFYNEVARRVLARHPDRIVGGLIYHSYTYPPDEVTPM
ncbi:MAG TPA: DUF4838 domain-containing protein, partial [Armatimonadota bacterium]|nr:DUF4838 domain-containing protein [Armatimonadota bacterium]